MTPMGIVYTQGSLLTSDPFILLHGSRTLLIFHASSVISLQSDFTATPARLYLLWGRNASFLLQKVNFLFSQTIWKQYTLNLPVQTLGVCCVLCGIWVEIKRMHTGTVVTLHHLTTIFHIPSVHSRKICQGRVSLKLSTFRAFDKPLLDGFFFVCLGCLGFLFCRFWLFSVGFLLGYFYLLIWVVLQGWQLINLCP